MNEFIDSIATAQQHRKAPVTSKTRTVIFTKTFEADVTNASTNQMTGGRMQFNTGEVRKVGRVARVGSMTKLVFVSDSMLSDDYYVIIPSNYISPSKADILASRLDELECAMKAVQDAYEECDLIGEDEIVVDAFCEKYPFQRSFDEECCEVSVWVEEVKKKMEEE